jgi:hypothetical protein
MSEYRRKFQETGISLVGAHRGTWGVRRLGILQMVGGLRKRASPFVGALLGGLWGRGVPLYGGSFREPGGGGPLVGAMKVMKGRL